MWPDGEKPVTLTFHITQIGCAFDLTMAAPRFADIPADVLPYLEPSPMMDPAGPIAREIAAQAKANTIQQTLVNLDALLSERMRFGRAVMGEPTSENILSQGTGYCWEFSKAFCACLRACGIPARRLLALQWFPDDDGSNTCFDPVIGGHLYVEFWAPGLGWVPWDGALGQGSFRTIPFVAETPGETDPRGTPERVFDEAFFLYYWHGSEAINPNLRFRLVGISLDEPRD